MMPMLPEVLWYNFIFEVRRVAYCSRELLQVTRAYALIRMGETLGECEGAYTNYEPENGNPVEELSLQHPSLNIRSFGKYHISSLWRAWFYAYLPRATTWEIVTAALGWSDLPKDPWIRIEGADRDGVPPRDSLCAVLKFLASLLRVGKFWTRRQLALAVAEAGFEPGEEPDAPFDGTFDDDGSDTDFECDSNFQGVVSSYGVAWLVTWRDARLDEADDVVDWGDGRMLPGLKRGRDGRLAVLDNGNLCERLTRLAAALSRRVDREARRLSLVRSDIAKEVVDYLRQRVLDAIVLRLKAQLVQVRRQSAFASIVGFADELLSPDAESGRVTELDDYIDCFGPSRRSCGQYEALRDLFHISYDVPHKLRASGFCADADTVSFWHHFDVRYGSLPRCLRFGSWSDGESRSIGGRRIVVWFGY
jgi:hypothetical protein